MTDWPNDRWVKIIKTHNLYVYCCMGYIIKYIIKLNAFRQTLYPHKMKACKWNCSVYGILQVVNPLDMNPVCHL